MKKQLFNKKNIVRSILLITIVMAAIIIPVFSKGNYLISTLVTCMLFASFGVSWNLIGGYGAQISWCHAAFCAIGAYTASLMYKYFNVSPWISMVPAMVIAFLLATLIGYGTLRLRGSFFSLATIAFAEIVRYLILYFKKWTGGASGVQIPFKNPGFSRLIFYDDKPFYYVMLVLLLAIVLISWLFSRSKIGHYLSTIKGDEDAATSLGIESFKVKLTAFQISAVLTSVIGVVYAFFLTYVEPGSIAGLDLSVKIGVVAIIGGVGTLWGPVLGAFILIPLIELTSSLLGQFGSGQLLYGLVLMIVVIFKPRGILSLFNDENAGKIKKLFSKTKKAKESCK